MPDGPAPPSLAELFERFLADLAIRKPSPHTVAAYRRDLDGVGRRLAAVTGHQPSELTAASLTRTGLRHAFASWAGDHAAASVRRAWSAWNGFVEFLVAEAELEANPLRAVTPPRSHRGRAKVIATEDAPSRLLQTAALADPTGRWPWPERDVALVATFLVTGLRLSEVVSLDLGSFEGPAGARRLVVVGKGGRARSIPTEHTYEQLVRRYLADRAERFPDHRLDEPASPLFVRADTGERPSRQQVEGWIDKLYRRAGLASHVPQGANVHALRHTFATTALEHGVDVVELQELLGHSSLDTTRRYLDATAAGLRHAIASHPAQAALRRFAAGSDTGSTDAGSPAPTAAEPLHPSDDPPPSRADRP